MILCRFTDQLQTAPRYGIVDNEFVLPLIDADAFGSRPRLHSDKLKLSEVQILAPVVPSKIVCVGRNYLDHAIELGNKVPEEPLLFLKAPSSVVASEDDIILPIQSEQVEHEGELGVIIGRTACRIHEDEDPLGYVLGYTCVNDVTARDLQRRDIQFTRAKSFDTFCPVGPWIVTDIDPANAEVLTRLNSKVAQQANTSLMAFPVSFLIRYISNIMTLNPGDLIATGTPAGVSRLQVGDEVEVEVKGVGVLRNRVKRLDVS